MSCWCGGGRRGQEEVRKQIAHIRLGLNDSSCAVHWQFWLSASAARTASAQHSSNQSVSGRDGAEVWRLTPLPRSGTQVVGVGWC